MWLWLVSIRHAPAWLGARAPAKQIDPPPPINNFTPRARLSTAQLSNKLQNKEPQLTWMMSAKSPRVASSDSSISPSINVSDTRRSCPNNDNSRCENDDRRSRDRSRGVRWRHPGLFHYPSVDSICGPRAVVTIRDGPDASYRCKTEPQRRSRFGEVSASGCV